MTALARSKYSPERGVRSTSRAFSRSVNAATRAGSMAVSAGVMDMAQRYKGAGYGYPASGCEGGGAEWSVHPMRGGPRASRIRGIRPLLPGIGLVTAVVVSAIVLYLALDGDPIDRSASDRAGV